MTKKSKTQMLAEAGIMIALSQLLSYFKLFTMPQGGSVTPGSTVPIILFALIWGGKYGLIASFTYGLLQFILGGGISIHPLSIVLDYFLAFGLLGVAGFFNKNLKTSLFGTTIAMFLRFLCSFLSGWIVFESYAPEGQAPWLYSLIYNATYMIPELIITLILVALLYNPLKKALKFK